jgi:hypothetical protein
LTVAVIRQSKRLLASAPVLHSATPLLPEATGPIWDCPPSSMPTTPLSRLGLIPKAPPISRIKAPPSPMPTLPRVPIPPEPRRSSTCDGSRFAPSLKLMEQE